MASPSVLRLRAAAEYFTQVQEINVLRCRRSLPSVHAAEWAHSSRVYIRASVRRPGRGVRSLNTRCIDGLMVPWLFLPWFCTFHSVKSGVWLDLFDCKILHLGICYGWRSGVIPCKLFIFQLGPRFSSATSLSARHLFVQRPELGRELLQE
ncbi:uncharacterized protein [Lolium perenne]|uniref:uncharacterized protein isoform X2 n=1 Tax=Lolium perenne TaxID=4522 RepID=UPI0021F51942|nr:uncharacterized protein LOC127297501 isoform X2 [Lolium perenne]